MNIQKVKKCIEAFNRIETAQDLKKAKITQAQYFEIGCTISEAVRAYNEKRNYKGETNSQCVCDWFMKHGAKVEHCGIGWHISL